MSSQAGPSSSRRAQANAASSSSRLHRAEENASRRAGASDFASFAPARSPTPAYDIGGDSGLPYLNPPQLRYRDFVAPSDLQEVLSARQILAQYKLESVYQDPLRVDFTRLKHEMEHTSFVGRAMQDALEEMLENPPTMEGLPPPPTFPEIPSPVLPPMSELPPLIPNSEGPQFGPDSDEEAEAAVSDFLERQRARIAERRKIRDDHNALCARIQADHYAAVDAQQGEVFATWDAERAARQAEVDEFQSLVTAKEKDIARYREMYLKESLVVGRQLRRDHEVRALTRHAVRLRDEASYLHEALVALQGNTSFGEDIDLLFEAVHLGDVPKGFGYVPIDAATAPVLPSVSTPSSKGKGVDRGAARGPGGPNNREEAGGKGKGKERHVEQLGEREAPQGEPRASSPSSRIRLSVSSGRRSGTASEQGAPERPSKQSRTEDNRLFLQRPPHLQPLRPHHRLPPSRDDMRLRPPRILIRGRRGSPSACPLAATFSVWASPHGKVPETLRILQREGVALRHGRRSRGQVANCASCVRAKVVCSPVRGGNANGLSHLRPSFAAPFNFEHWYPPDIDWRSAAERRTKVPFKWTVAAAQKGGANESGSSSKRRMKEVARVESDVEMEEEETEEDAESSRADETETEPTVPPIATLPGSSESQIEKPVSQRAKFTFNAADLLGGSMANNLPRSQYSSRHHLPRDDFDMPVPPDSCFGKMRAWNIPQENYSLPVTAARYHARQSWNISWFMEMSRMIVYSAGAEFASALMRNSSPLDEMAPEEPARPLIVDGIPFPCPVPTLDSDEAWRTTALLKARAYPQSLRFARALLDADTEGRILRGEGRRVNEHLPEGWDIADLFGFFAKDELHVKQEIEEREANSLFLPGEPLRSTPFDSEQSPPLLGPRPLSPSADLVLEAPHLGVNHRLAASAGISPEIMRESLLAAAPRSGDARAEGSSRVDPSRRPTDDEIPLYSDGRATSLAAEMRASSLADLDRTPGPTADSPLPLKEEADEEERVAPHVDARLWNAEGDTLEEMDLTGGSPEQFS
ncbi:hypothetical protein B0H16DRAFT_1453910 [Mycena metata]|uniref:Uncharacterized protein n=1 Tax=Mycena metata TaxID=1033252 RepID=A0AAD7JN98_9AGAR|nr:hypothetical protein B0H16DRAFT_1453910 [Mycena metata]